MTEITLHYFDCRGRGEAIRNLLLDRQVEFDDHRIPFDDLRATLPALKQDAAQTGPFGLLPLLDWKGTRIPQTLAIASYLSRELDLHQGLSNQQIAREEAISNGAYLDLTNALPQLAWAPLYYPEAPFERILKMLTRIPCEYPKRLERVLTEQGDWFSGTDARFADYFVREGLDAWSDFLGQPYADAIARLPLLSAWKTRIETRVRSPKSALFTASRFEPEVKQRCLELVRTSGLPWPM